MSELQQYSGNSSVLTGGSSWSSHGRELSRIASQAERQVAQVAAKTHVENAKLDALDMVASRALQSTAMVTQLEIQLAEAVPAAAFRLAQIGQAHTLTMMGELHDFSRRLR